jgi:hypothetical protein
MQWNAITHGGYIDHQQKYPNGFCTWLYAHVGVKILAIIRPKYTTDDTTPHKVNNLHSRIVHSEPEGLREHADVFSIFLSAGRVL